MKKLSEFKDEKAIAVVADLLPVLMDMLTNPENKKLKDVKNPFEMFSGFFKNSAEHMIKIFAILSEEDVKTYHCDGVEAMQNIMAMAMDDKLLTLFTSQSQMGDATSSGSASQNTEE